MRTLASVTLSAVCVALTVGGAQATAAKGGQPATAGKGARISVNRGLSFCTGSGITDPSTGTGKVSFYITLRNRGPVAGKVSIWPVRHYSDGKTDESALDMLVGLAVPAHATKSFKSRAYTYKASEHEIKACGVRVNGGPEVRIIALHKAQRG
jgi:hypothetical protein